MGSGAIDLRFGAVFFTMEDAQLSFPIADARVEIIRAVNSQGRRSGSSLDIRVHIILDLVALTSSTPIAPQLFNIAVQADDIVQKFKVTWHNPVTGDPTAGFLITREFAFSGWCSGFEMYRPELTGSTSFGASEGTSGTRIGSADQLLHCTFAVATDDDNIGNLTFTE